MLAAEALRLAAVEALAPTAAVTGTAEFPTLAGQRVYDCAFMAPDDLDADAAFTPCLSIFTDDVRIERRGDSSSSTLGNPTVALVVIAELAVAGRDDEGDLITMPLGGDDAKAQLVLGALLSQVRKVLMFAPAGSPFRRIAGAVTDVRIEPFALPQYDFRWMRTTMRFTCMVADDKFTDGAGLPEPIKGFAAALPAGSYAKGKLAELATFFAATDRASLNIVFSTKDSLPTAPEGKVP